MDLKKILMNIGILSLLVFSMMSFIITTQVENSVTIPITNDSRLNSAYSYLEANISASGSSSQKALNNFGNTTPTQEYGELEVTSIVSPTNTAKTIILGFWGVIVRLPMSVLGVSESVIGLLGGLLLIFVIIGIWAIWKGVVT